MISQVIITWLMLAQLIMNMNIKQGMEGQEKCPSRQLLSLMTWRESGLWSSEIHILTWIWHTHSHKHKMPHTQINKYNLNAWGKFYEQNEYFYILINWWILFTYAHILFFYVCLCVCLDVLWLPVQNPK